MVFQSWSCYFGLGLGLKNLVLFTSLQGSELVGLAAPSPRTPPRSQPSASIFGPWTLFGIFQQSSFPPMHRGIDKTLVIPIFGAKLCIRMQEFVLKIYKKKSERPRGTRGDICSHSPSCPPARCWCPSTSSRLATALTVE